MRKRGRRECGLSQGAGDAANPGIGHEQAGFFSEAACSPCPGLSPIPTPILGTKASGEKGRKISN